MFHTPFAFFVMTANPTPLAVLALSLLLPAAAQAQTEPAAAPEVRHLLRLVPQEFLVHTFRTDWEFRTGPKASVQVSPSFTSAENTGEYKRITGAGLELQRKFYLRTEEVSLRGFYGGLAASYHRYSLTDANYYRYDYLTGVTYYEPRKERVNRFAANLVLGYQFLLKEVIALDVYAGGGIRASQSDQDNNLESYHLFDPRYNGIAPKVGFSVGVVL